MQTFRRQREFYRLRKDRRPTLKSLYRYGLVSNFDKIEAAKRIAMARKEIRQGGDEAISRLESLPIPASRKHRMKDKNSAMKEFEAIENEWAVKEGIIIDSDMPEIELAVQELGIIGKNCKIVLFASPMSGAYGRYYRNKNEGLIALSITQASFFASDMFLRDLESFLRFRSMLRSRVARKELLERSIGPDKNAAYQEIINIVRRRLFFEWFAEIASEERSPEKRHLRMVYETLKSTAVHEDTHRRNECSPLIKRHDVQDEKIAYLSELLCAEARVAFSQITGSVIEYDNVDVGYKAGSAIFIDLLNEFGIFGETDRGRLEKRIEEFLALSTSEIRKFASKKLVFSLARYRDFMEGSKEIGEFIQMCDRAKSVALDV